MNGPKGSAHPESPAASDIRLCLAESARTVGLEGPSDAKTTAGLQPGEPDTAVLDTLVRLAGSGKHPVSEAAMLERTAWPDRGQLLRNCLAWQRCDSPLLRNWTHNAFAPDSGARRVYYDTAPAE